MGSFFSILIKLENIFGISLDIAHSVGNGPGAIAELVKPQIESSISNVILIDGVRSNDEIQVLKKFGTVKLLAVHASTDTRFDF